jgi:hypothetical protein
VPKKILNLHRKGQKYVFCILIEKIIFFDAMGRCKLKKKAVPKIRKHVTLDSDQILHPINDQILPSLIPVPHEEKVASQGT